MVAGKDLWGETMKGSRPWFDWFLIAIFGLMAVFLVILLVLAATSEVQENVLIEQVDGPDFSSSNVPSRGDIVLPAEPFVVFSNYHSGLFGYSGVRLSKAIL